MKVYSDPVLELSEFRMRMVALKGSLARQGRKLCFKNEREMSLVADFPLGLCETQIGRSESAN